MTPYILKTHVQHSNPEQKVIHKFNTNGIKILENNAMEIKFPGYAAPINFFHNQFQVQFLGSKR